MRTVRPGNAYAVFGNASDLKPPDRFQCSRVQLIHVQDRQQERASRRRPSFFRFGNDIGDKSGALLACAARKEFFPQAVEQFPCGLKRRAPVFEQKKEGKQEKRKLQEMTNTKNHNNMEGNHENQMEEE